MWKKRLTTAALATLVLAGASCYMPVPATAAMSAPTCNRVDATVRVSPLDITPHHIVGWLCWQGTLQNQTVQILTSGLTYDHFYWDWPQQPELYSYVYAATGSGYATFAYDRLGVGESDRVNALSLNTLSESYVAHQLIQGLRSGTVGGHAFAKVISVGHSLGSAIIDLEANTYHDVDGVIVSGFAHMANASGFAPVAATLTPAQLDPQFAGAGLPLGYITTGAETRAFDFYDTSNADPAVIAYDEATKQTGTAGELATFATSLSPTSTRFITAPVLAAVGQTDRLICDSGLLFPCTTSAFLTRESSGFSPAACLEAYTLPNSGHDMNLHLTATSWFTAANAWADSRVGTNGHAPTNPCH